MNTSTHNTKFFRFRAMVAFGATINKIKSIFSIPDAIAMDMQIGVCLGMVDYSIAIQIERESYLLRNQIGF